MVSDSDVPDFAHPISVGGDTEAGLRVSVEAVRFRAGESQKANPILNFDKVLGSGAHYTRVVLQQAKLLRA